MKAILLALAISCVGYWEVDLLNPYTGKVVTHQLDMNRHGIFDSGRNGSVLLKVYCVTHEDIQVIEMRRNYLYDLAPEVKLQSEDLNSIGG